MTSTEYPGNLRQLGNSSMQHPVASLEIILPAIFYNTEDSITHRASCRPVFGLAVIPVRAVATHIFEGRYWSIREAQQVHLSVRYGENRRSSSRHQRHTADGSH